MEGPLQINSVERQPSLIKSNIKNIKYASQRNGTIPYQFVLLSHAIPQFVSSVLAIFSAATTSTDANRANLMFRFRTSPNRPISTEQFAYHSTFCTTVLIVPFFEMEKCHLEAKILLQP